MPEVARETLRKGAGFAFGASVVIMLFSAYIAFVYSGAWDAGTDFVVSLDFGVWIAIFVILLVLLAIAMAVLFVQGPNLIAHGAVAAGGRRQVVEEDDAPRPDAPEPADLQVDCDACGEAYVISDTGERPLAHACPYCDQTSVLPAGGVDEDAPLVEAEAEEPEERPKKSKGGTFWGRTARAKSEEPELDVEEGSAMDDR